MKIAVLSSHTPSLLWFRMDMMLAFQKAGHDVLAVGNESEEKWAPVFREQGIEYRCIPVQRNGTNPIKDIKTKRALAALLKTERPDKIFAYQAKTVIYGSKAAYKAGIEVYSLIAGLGSVFLSDGIKNRLLRMIVKSSYRHSLQYNQSVFFQNPDDVQTFEKYGMVRQEQVVMINGSGVNLQKFTPRPFPDRFAFLFIGRLIRDKGIFEYLDACRILKGQYTDLRCLLVGPLDSNPTSLKAEELQPYINGGVIEYFGEQTDVRPFLEQCSVFVLPSYREGTPKTVLEAMACYRPVITTDAPGCRETIEDGKSGYLIAPKNVQALVEKMAFLYEHREMLDSMAKNGYTRVKSVFDVDLVNEKILKTMKC